MTELKKKLTEKLIKRVFNHSELIDEIITDFKESEEFKQLILSGVVSSACKKAEIIEVLNNRRKQAFDNDFHKYENNEMRQAIDIVVRLLPND